MSEYEGRRAALIAYLKVKTDQCDWHAVTDASIDLRDMEAEERGRSQRALGKYAPIIGELNTKVSQ